MQSSLRRWVCTLLGALAVAGLARPADGATILAPETTVQSVPGSDATTAAFTFLVYGDTRSGDNCTGNATHIGIVNRMMGETASFAFHTGDMITGYTNTTNWVQNGACTAGSSYGSFLNLTTPLRNRTPAPGLPMFLYPVLGNHDGAWGDNWYPDAYGSGICSVFNPQLFVPNHTTKSYFHWNTDNAPKLTDAQFYAAACSVTTRDVYPDYMYYSFDYSGAHFLVLRIDNDYSSMLDCNSCSGNYTNYSDYYQAHQLDFVNYDLTQARANPAIKNIYVLLHAPMFTSCEDHPGTASTPLLSKLFTQYKVTAVFSGHDHVYERTVPIMVDTAHPNGVQDNQLGTVYMVTGGGGSPLHDFKAAAWFDVTRSSVNHYLRVTVNGSTTTLSAVDASGVQFDSYTWTSANGGCTTNAQCDDGNVCNGSETCSTGSCVAGAALSCNDSNACTTDSCAPATGCSHAALTCTDSNACTTDSCLPAIGCSYTPITCNDSNLCTTDSCVPATGACIHAPQTCSDANTCTADSCDPVNGCAHNPVSCDDGIPCTVDSCNPASGCTHSAGCNDGNPCTDDACGPTGCVFVANSAPCNDGEACTMNDVCSAGACTGGGLLFCDDGNACTLDSCNGATGCVFTNNAAACNDGNPCTDDACSPLTGCTFPVNTAPCDDGNACTAGDTCLGGVCVGGAPESEGIASPGTCFDGLDNDCDGVADLDCAIDATSQLVVAGAVTSGSTGALAATSPNQGYETIAENGNNNKKTETVVWTFDTSGVPPGTLCELRVEGFLNSNSNDTFPFSAAKRSTTATCASGESWGSTIFTLQKPSDDDQLQGSDLGAASTTYCVRAKDSKTASDSQADTLSLDRVFVFPTPVAASDHATPADKGTVLGGTTFEATQRSDEVYQRLKEANVGGVSRLVHTWKFTGVPAGSSHRLHLEGNRTQTGTDSDNFQFFWSASDPAGSVSETAGFTQIGSATIKSTTDTSGGQDFSFGSSVLPSTVYIRVIDNKTTSGAVLDTLNLDHLAIKTVP
jgi:hypothetical protein